MTIEPLPISNSATDITPQTTFECEVILRELQPNDLKPVVKASIFQPRIPTPVLATLTTANSILKILQDTRRETADERTLHLGRFSAANSDLNNAKRNLVDAQHKERLAVHVDEEMKAEMGQLTGYINNNPDNAQMFREKLARQQGEQYASYRARVAAGEITRLCQREVSEAESKCAVAQETLKVSDQRIADLDARIEKARG